jgi:hypothetical protein
MQRSVIRGLLVIAAIFLVSGCVIPGIDIERFGLIR